MNMSENEYLGVDVDVCTEDNADNVTSFIRSQEEPEVTDDESNDEDVLDMNTAPPLINTYSECIDCVSQLI